MKFDSINSIVSIEGKAQQLSMVEYFDDNNKKQLCSKRTVTTLFRTVNISTLSLCVYCAAHVRVVQMDCAIF